MGYRPRDAQADILDAAYALDDMNAQIEIHSGRQVLRVFYNPITKDWNERIEAALAAYGLSAGRVLVIAVPATGDFPKPKHEKEVIE